MYTFVNLSLYFFHDKHVSFIIFIRNQSLQLQQNERMKTLIHHPKRKLLQKLQLREGNIVYIFCIRSSNHKDFTLTIFPIAKVQSVQVNWECRYIKHFSNNNLFITARSNKFVFYDWNWGWHLYNACLVVFRKTESEEDEDFDLEEEEEIQQTTTKRGNMS